jgi:hypothetical protein
MTTPDWLKTRGGELKVGSDKKTYYVVVGHKPLYDLVTLPASGKHVCSIRQTQNGQRIDSKGVYASADEALRGGLEDLRSFLGWA